MTLKFKRNQRLLLQKHRISLQDAKVWKKVRELGFEWTAVRICRGYAFLCQVSPMRVSSWNEKVSVSINQNVFASEEDKLLYLSACRRDYLDWADNCEESGISHLAVIDVLYFGETCKFVEQKYRHRHGWGMKNLINSLYLYRK